MSAYSKVQISTLIVLSILLILMVLFTFVIFYQQQSVFPTNASSAGRKVILISMDGFRHDYLEKARAMNISLPAFESMARAGVRGMQVMNAFPTVTLPNHQTLVTGLYPESNDMVLNNFRDPNYPGKEFQMNDQNDLNEEFWYTDMPEPIWVTLQRQQNRLSGSMLWPITDAPFANDLPFQQVSQFTMLDGIPARYLYKKRVDDVIWWLTNPRYTLDLILMYFDEPDETGHAYGPNSQAVMKKLQELDSYLAYLMQRLREKQLLDQVDIILTADHGMSEISSDRLIEMDRYVSPDLYTYTLLTPVGTLYPKKDSDLPIMYEKLKNAHPNMSVYVKGSVPAQLHYNNNRRIAPLILVADNGWSIVHKKSDFAKKIAPTASVGGNHGYDPVTSTDVHPFFLALGRSFRVNFTTPVLHSVDVYPLMCHLLDLQPQPNNGSLARIVHILSPESQQLIGRLRWWRIGGQDMFRLSIGFMWVLMATAGFLFGAYIAIARIRRHRKRQDLLKQSMRRWLLMKKHENAG